MNRLLLVFIVAFSYSNAFGQVPEMPRREPNDLRDLNAHCPFTPPTDLASWHRRAADLRLQLNVSLGLHPPIELPAVRPEIYGRVERDGYSIQRIVFESLPGFKVTGSLFLPNPLPEGRNLPGVLCPHGHWADARFRVAPKNEQDEALASGAERFRNAAAHHIQARCVQLARMGCAVLHWDMIGYCDSQQISQQRAHGFANQAKEIEVTKDGWLLFSPTAENNLQSILGLQALATKRAVDALLTLDYVDPKRIAITGASGGGTQSFLGAVTDDRIRVAFPAVMVSTGMQGGCTCENASLLRIGTNNAEIAALIAPRPLGMTAADDWTRTMPQDGFPEIQSVYQLHNASKAVALFPALHYGHNFNHVSRVSMYGWMNEHLNLGYPTPVLERDFEPALADELSVWDAEHPQPPSGLDFERRLLANWAELNEQAIQSASDNQKKQTLTDGWKVCLGLTSLENGKTTANTREGSIEFESQHLGKWSANSANTDDNTSGDDSPVGIRITVTGAGKMRHFYLPSLGSSPQSLVPNPRLAAAYTYGYNLPEVAVAARRVAETLEACRTGGVELEFPIEEIKIAAHGADAAIGVAALFCLKQTTSSTTRITPDLQIDGFRFADADSISSANFLPGSVKYGDIEGLTSLIQAE